MHLKAAASAVLLVLSHVVDAVVPSQFCATKLGKVAPNTVPTTTIIKTITIPVITTVKSTPVKTITPSPVTTTVYTSTLTVTRSASTTITTTVTSGSTVSVPTPAGFTPISQENGYVPKIKGRDTRNLAPRAEQKIFGSLTPGTQRPVFSPAVYPTAVTCISISKVATTKTITIPVLTTSITTLTPVTQTIKASITITTTSTTTSTATETVQPTSYAACSPANFINSANGGAPTDSFDANNLAFIGTGYTREDCCALCQNTALCRGSVSNDGDECYLIGGEVGGTCKPGMFQGDGFYTRTVPGNEGIIFSNGPCGALANKGDYQDPPAP